MSMQWKGRCGQISIKKIMEGAGPSNDQLKSGGHCGEVVISYMMALHWSLDSV